MKYSIDTNSAKKAYMQFIFDNAKVKLLKSANLGKYSVEISSNGETSNLFKLIGQSNIIDELKQKGFHTNYTDLSSYGDNRVFIIKWDKEY